MGRARVVVPNHSLELLRVVVVDVVVVVGAVAVTLGDIPVDSWRGACFAIGIYGGRDVKERKGLVVSCY